ncbi:MAG TPA: hypothetical protein VMY98_10230 [Anaerolineae bacterium]|nr:hypothetical protein [Anaerolineae bacterium]
MQLHKDSHVDHGLSGQQLGWILGLMSGPVPGGLFIKTVELPAELGTAPCALYGPDMGDGPVPEAAVHYAKRGDRAYDSRLIRLPARQTRLVTVVAGPHEEHDCILYTAYAGPAALREPGDATIPSHELGASRTYWKLHALASINR